MPELTISKRFTFEASHVLPQHRGKCSRLHGHSWELIVAVRGPVDEHSGFVQDYGELSQIVKSNIIDVVDHQHLGYGHVQLYGTLQQLPVLGSKFYPSSENLVVAFARMLQPFIHEFKGIKLHEIRLRETCTSEAIWTPEGASHATA